MTAVLSYYFTFSFHFILLSTPGHPPRIPREASAVPRAGDRYKERKLVKSRLCGAGACRQVPGTAVSIRFRSWMEEKWKRLSSLAD